VYAAAVESPASGMEINVLNEIWPELIQKAIEPPKTIVETVDRLITVLDDEHKIIIAAMLEEDLGDLHFSLGLAIRNAFGFWDSQSPLLTSCKTMKPDDISDQIILELWERLNRKTGSHAWNDTFSG
jgi:hypothetical protein